MIAECVLTVIAFVHVFLWVFMIFGGFVSVFWAKVIIEFMIPFVYVVHILPFHVLVKSKVELIFRNYDSFLPEFLGRIREMPAVTVKEREEIRSYLPEGSSDEMVDNVVQICKIENNMTIVGGLFNHIFDVFRGSFQNPLSPQGLLILGLLVNYFLLRFRYNVVG